MTELIDRAQAEAVAVKQLVSHRVNLARTDHLTRCEHPRQQRAPSRLEYRLPVAECRDQSAETSGIADEHSAERAPSGLNASTRANGTLHCWPAWIPRTR